MRGASKRATRACAASLSTAGLGVIVGAASADSHREPMQLHGMFEVSHPVFLFFCGVSCGHVWPHVRRRPDLVNDFAFHYGCELLQLPQLPCRELTRLGINESQGSYPFPFWPVERHAGVKA